MIEENLHNEAEETTSQETIETNVEGQNGEGEAVDWEAKAKKLEEDNRKLYARVKKDTNKEKPKDNSVQIDRLDEIEFFSRGGDRDGYDQLKLIMQGAGISFAEAKEHPLFVSFVEQKAEEARKEKAQLGASSGQGNAEKSPIQTAKTRDEHKEAFNKLIR